jgi:hypothetical protein
MLWRDDQGADQHEGSPHEETRQALRMLRRAMLVAAVLASVLMAFANWPT